MIRIERFRQQFKTEDEEIEYKLKFMNNITEFINDKHSVSRVISVSQQVYNYPESYMGFIEAWVTYEPPKN